MNVLFIKEKEEDTVNNLLNRILNFATRYAKENNSMPDLIKMSKRDLKMIEEYNKTLINEDNEFLGMKVITYRENYNEFQRNRK